MRASRTRAPGRWTGGCALGSKTATATSSNATTIISLGGPPFEKCAQPTEGQLEPGQTYDSCTLFLVEEGREPDRASFLPYVPAEETDFVYWDATVPEAAEE